MRPHSPAKMKFKPGLALVLLMFLMGTLVLAGGASRADVTGQSAVRGAAWGVLILALLFGQRPAFGMMRFVVAIMLSALALALVQLVPLPPAIWQAFPGRDFVSGGAMMAGHGRDWRPWSLVPSATFNAAGSLIVPFASAFLLAGLSDGERSYVPGVLLTAIVASMMLGMMQVGGVGFDNIFVNDSLGDVNGGLANRNHFALLLAMGCIVAPVWAFLDGRRAGWRAPVALGLTILFTLMILATGSRAGLLLGALGLGCGITLVSRGIREEMRRFPRWAPPVLIAMIVAVIAVFILLSVATDRAASISRAFTVGQDMRSLGRGTVSDMVSENFPVGSGLGGFDPMFRMHEPFSLLKPSYFNHAHNEFGEIVLDTGLFGIVLLLAVFFWWAFFSWRAWRAGSNVQHAIPKLGSAILLLVLVASAFDYPARTPFIMAISVIAAVWLSWATGKGINRTSALPDRNQPI